MAGSLEKVKAAARALAGELNASRLAGQCGSFHAGVTVKGTGEITAARPREGKMRLTLRKLQDIRYTLHVASKHDHIPLEKAMWLRQRIIHHLNQHAIEVLPDHVVDESRERMASGRELHQVSGIPATHSFVWSWTIKTARPATQ